MSFIWHALLINVAVFAPLAGLIWYLAIGVRPPDDDE